MEYLVSSLFILISLLLQTSAQTFNVGDVVRMSSDATELIHLKQATVWKTISKSEAEKLINKFAVVKDIDGDTYELLFCPSSTYAYFGPSFTKVTQESIQSFYTTNELQQRLKHSIENCNETVVQEIISKKPDKKYEDQIDKMLQQHFNHPVHQIFLREMIQAGDHQSACLLASDTDALINNTNIYGIDKVYRTGHVYVEQKSNITLVYRGKLSLPPPLVNGTLSVDDFIRGEVAQFEVHRTTEENIEFDFRIVFNTELKRILHVGLTYPDGVENTWLPPVIMCPYDLSYHCDNFFQDFVEKSFVPVEDELIRIFKTLIRDSKLI